MMRNRRPTSSQPAAPPRLRLRYPLMLLVLAGLGYALVPRMRAVWSLHDRATALANYALCMAGPTGPAALKTAPAEFASLLRRRLLTAAPTQAPFAACSELARVASGDAALAELASASAADFVEYGRSSDADAERHLSRLLLGPGSLARLAAEAWPFGKDDVVALIQPSSHAKEAPHPAAVPTPLTGRGLPATSQALRSTWNVPGRWLAAFGGGTSLQLYESRDGGLVWQPASLNQPDILIHAGRCSSSLQPARHFVPHFEAAGRLLLMSVEGDVVRGKSELRGAARVRALSCDSTRALLVVLDESGVSALFQCPFGGECSEVDAARPWLSGRFDIAQVEGTSVLLTSEGGVGRVRSSRDGGRHWTPASVAYDSGESVPGRAIVVPTRLLVMGSRLLMYGGSTAGYGVLFSDDGGASWRGEAEPGTAALQALIP